ncbi:nucleoside phosphorylase [Natronomonas gomsonensis]|uniref:nucleoside phosphorylase n=1 Tax=Natronomonas gomsonensis TaxID=1046043 RepID=UPI0020CA83B9|nr:nucleoside phosphorylase [Natronomonas gomsonensis]MCY4729371.1 nucleoside phosphorylase [Natronomonas gomsonensis]
MTADSEDPNDDEQYHVELADGDIEGPVLLPGDPNRVEIIADCWDEYRERASHREYRTLAGMYDDEPLAVTSTGIGSPSAAIAVEELARIGAESFIRVGSCGAIQEGASVGDLVITTAAVRQEGTSDEYVREDYPAAADDEVVTALVTAAERLDHDYHLGVTCSTDSFYDGQSRPGFEGFRAAGAEERIEELQAAGVLNFEMEASAILTLSSLYGLRAGAVCTVYANRVTGEFRTEGQRKAAETASLAAALLSKMDREKANAGVDHWHAGLSLDDG